MNQSFTLLPNRVGSGGKARRVEVRAFWTWLLPLLALTTTTFVYGKAVETQTVFDGPVSEYADLGRSNLGKSSGPLRVLHVEERSGVARAGDLVRVPVFFAEGECPSLETLAIVRDDQSNEEMLWQADDIRRGPDGGVSRVHLYFAVDLKPGEKRRYKLIRREDPELRSAAAALKAEMTHDEIQVSTDAGLFVWSKTGEVLSLPGPNAGSRFASPGAFPRVLIKFPAQNEQPAADVVLDGSIPQREVSWSTGPLFAKIRLEIFGSDGVSLQQDYRLPRHGREVIVTAALNPGKRAGGVVRENRLLQGALADAPSDATKVEHIPAGIRYPLRREHAYSVTALQTSSAGALLAVPLVIGGSNGTWRVEKDGVVTLNGLQGLRRGNEGEKDTLTAFWTEVRLVSLETPDETERWESYRRHVQPLVAVVEEPGASVDRLHAALREVVREMKPVGWRQEAGRAHVMGGDPDRVMRILNGGAPKEQDRDRLVRGARGARAKLTNNGTRKLREDEKGRAYGGLDPYHITYTQSAAAALAELPDAPPLLTTVNAVMASAVREEGGRVDAAGYPYIDCFNRTLNMQLGPVLFGLTAGAKSGDHDLARFYRDLATAPPVQGVFGRAQRPYTGASAVKPDQTDFLYQAICDFWLRATEVLGNENLSIHPLAYARYTDCIDVMADQYHGVAANDKPGTTGQARANFYRGQAHTHRWLGWSCAPYIRLLEDPAENAAVGLTEAIHYSESLKGRWKNWPDLTYYVLADMLIREHLGQSKATDLPERPVNVKSSRTRNGVELTWTAVNQAVGYRIYRAEQPGGPYRWLNSPYLMTPLPAVEQPAFRDTTATPESVYVITAVDGSGRESRWSDSP